MTEIIIDRLQYRKTC